MLPSTTTEDSLKNLYVCAKRGFHDMVLGVEKRLFLHCI
jgi:hypothetical protein